MSLFGPPNIDQMKAKRDVNGLIKALSYQLKSYDPGHIKVRKAAARALGDLGSPQAIEALIGVLGANLPEERNNAVIALIKVGAPAVGPLGMALQSSSISVCTGAATALGDIDSKDGFLPLVKALESRYVDVRQAAVKSLGKLNDPRAVEPLIGLLRDEPKIQVEVLEALGKYKDRRVVEPLITELTNPTQSGENKAAMIKILFGLQDRRCVEPIIHAFNNPQSDWHIRQAAARALGELKDDRAVEPLLNELMAKEEHVHKSAREAVHHAPENDTVEPRDRAQKNEAWDVCLLVVHSLGELGDARAVKTLIKIVTMDDHWWALRKAAAEALGKIGDLRAAVPLAAVAEDHREYGLKPPRVKEARQVRQACAEAAARLQENLGKDVPATVDILMASLSNKEQNREAYATLLKLGPQAVEPLIGKLNDPDIVQRTSAVTLLGRLGDARAYEPLLNLALAGGASQDEAGLAAIVALGRLGDVRAVEPILGMFQNGLKDFFNPAKHDKLLEAAATALGDLGDKRAVESLISALQRSDDAVRVAVVEALGKIGDARAVEPLLDIMGKPQTSIYRVDVVREAAARAVGKLYDPRVVSTMVNVITNKYGDRDVRVATAVELVRMYHSGRLDEASKQRILEQRPLITGKRETKLHETNIANDMIDKQSSGWSEDVGGLDVDFPI